MKIREIYRNSETGEICSEEYALANKSTTQKETIKEPEFADAVKLITDTLKKDEDIYHGWKSMIANAVYDTFKEKYIVNRNPVEIEELQKVANEAAEKFLNSIMYTGGN